MSAPIEVSSRLAAVLEGGSWRLVIASTETTVYRVSFEGGRTGVYVKFATGGPAGPSVAVAAEHERLTWLADRVAVVAPVPIVVAYEPGSDDLPAALVTEALPGEPDLRMLPDVDTAVGLLGHTLAGLHALDPAGCPFDAGPDAELERVRARLESGVVDVAELPPGYHRIAPARIAELVASMHPGPIPPGDQVLVHGDLSVTNLLFNPATGEASGLVDWRWCGLGDRHLDLAVTARSIVRNFGAEVLPSFFESYGLPRPDSRRLEFYGVLEELS